MSALKDKKYGIIGFGAFGKQLLAFLTETGLHKEEEFVFFDDTLCDKGFPYLPFGAYKSNDYSGLEFFSGLGYKHLVSRKGMLSWLRLNNRKTGSFVHGSAFVHPTAIIEEGSIIYPLCNIDRNVIIKQGVVLNNSVTVSHDSIVGGCNFLAPGVVFSGNVKTGDCCFFGTGSLVANNLVIGANVTVGIGGVLSRHVKDGLFLTGNPARIIQKGFKLH